MIAIIPKLFSRPTTFTLQHANSTIAVTFSISNIFLLQMQ